MKIDKLSYILFIIAAIWYVLSARETHGNLQTRIATLESDLFDLQNKVSRVRFDFETFEEDISTSFTYHNDDLLLIKRILNIPERDRNGFGE